MTKHQIAALCCRLLGLYVVFISLQSLLLNLISLTTLSKIPGYGLYVSLGFITGLASLSLGLGLWILADKLAAKMVGDENSSMTSLAVSAEQAQAIAFSVVGLFVHSNAIPSFVQWVTYQLLAKNLGHFQLYGDASQSA